MLLSMDGRSLDPDFIKIGLLHFETVLLIPSLPQGNKNLDSCIFVFCVAK